MNMNEMSDNAFWVIVVSVVSVCITALSLRGGGDEPRHDEVVYQSRIHEDDTSRMQCDSLGEGGEMKTAVWNWTKVVAFVPGMWLMIIFASPLLAAFTAYDAVFLGWWDHADDVKKGKKK